jgi:energy-coupling factor transporter ATP-binding protein EcfA2
VILVTHEGDIAAHAERRVVLRDGKVVSDSSPGAAAGRASGRDASPQPSPAGLPEPAP